MDPMDKQLWDTTTLLPSAIVSTGSKDSIGHVIADKVCTVVH